MPDQIITARIIHSKHTAKLTQLSRSFKIINYFARFTAGKKLAKI
jgi:hypothetical protein